MSLLFHTNRVTCIIIKVQYGCPGQVDISSWQVNFYSHLPDGQVIMQVACPLNHLKSELVTVVGLAQSKQN